MASISPFSLFGCSVGLQHLPYLVTSPRDQGSKYLELFEISLTDKSNSLLCSQIDSFVCWRIVKGRIGNNRFSIYIYIIHPLLINVNTLNVNMTTNVNTFFGNKCCSLMLTLREKWTNVWTKRKLWLKSLDFCVYYSGFTLIVSFAPYRYTFLEMSRLNFPYLEVQLPLIVPFDPYRSKI